MRIEQRDRDVISEVFLSRMVRRGDLLSLGYFTSVQRCNARLLDLRKAGFLKIRDEVMGLAFRVFLYSCTAKGVRIAAEHLSIPETESIAIHRAGMGDLTVRHALRCTDLRIRFLEAAKRAEGLCLLEWFQELLCHHEFRGVDGETTIMKPDALARVEIGGEERFLFIEVDLGNASLPKIREKAGRYSLYSECGAFSEAFGVSDFYVLWVTTDERRLRRMQSVAGLPNILFTTWKRLNEESLLGKVISRGSEKRVSLVEALR